MVNKTIRFFLAILIALMIFPVDILAQSQPPYGKPRKPLFPSRRSQALERTGWDFGISIGAANSLTDIGGGADESRPLFLDAQIKTTSLSAGAFARYQFSPLLALKTAVGYVHIHGADSLSPVGSSRYNRDFYFENEIFELALTAEVYLPKVVSYSPLDIYGFAGIGMFYHNPQLTVPNPYIFVKDDYSLLQPVIPMGAGVSYTFFKRYRIGYEITWRKTFTDYLDGFTRPASKGNDSYFFNTFTLSIYPHIRPQYSQRVY